MVAIFVNGILHTDYFYKTIKTKLLRTITNF